MAVKKFKAKLQGTGRGGGVYVLIPYDVEKEYGKKNMIPVKATFDGEPYTGSIANMGFGPCLGVLKAIQEKLGKDVGDTVNVTVEADTAPRTIEIPAEIKTLLNKNKAEKDFFDTLSYTNRKEYVRWITDAKREETKLARLDKMLTLLKGKKKNPSGGA